MGLQGLTAGQLNPPQHPLVDGVHDGKAGDVVHGGLPGQYNDDIATIVVNKIIIPGNCRKLAGFVQSLIIFPLFYFTMHDDKQFCSLS